jgi:hypothetical protein
MQGIQVDGFGLAVIKIAVAPFAAALGLTDIDPVGRLITGPRKPAGIHKSLGQIQGMSIESLPVPAQPLKTEG